MLITMIASFNEKFYADIYDGHMGAYWPKLSAIRQSNFGALYCNNSANVEVQVVQHLWFIGVN